MSDPSRQVERRLLARETGLPGLALVLDDDALSVAVGRPVRVTRLRHKPGTSVVAAFEPVGSPGEGHGWVASYLSPVKAPATVGSAAERGMCARLLDGSGRTAVGEVLADRRLVRAAARLRERYPDLLASARVVRHNPHRRLVLRAVLDGREVAVKIGARGAPPSELPRLSGRLAAAGLPVLAERSLPGVRGVVVADWWGAGDLLGRPSVEHAAAAGRALAAVHRDGRGGALDAPPAPGRTGPDVVRAAEALAVLDPGLGARAVGLARTVADLLDRQVPSPRVLLHGDLSPDQVLVGEGGVRLIDLDRATSGPTEQDLGSFAAVCRLDGADQLVAPFLGGYLDAADRGVDRGALAVWTAAASLYRVTEPFRTRQPDWVGRTEQILDLVERSLAERRPAVRDVAARGPSAAVVSTPVLPATDLSTGPSTGRSGTSPGDPTAIAPRRARPRASLPVERRTS